VTARTVARLGLLVAVAVTLQVAESLVPKPLPWLRLGLANAVTLLAIVRLGVRSAAFVTTVRVLLGALLLGTLGGPSFLLSASGSVAALLAMAIAERWGVPPLSLLGVSVLGSASHVAGQLLALAWLSGAGSAVLGLGPILAFTAVPLGLVTGAVVVAVDRRLVPWEAAW
jgi:heptaprenyl diphosphate synthase